MTEEIDEIDNPFEYGQEEFSGVWDKGQYEVEEERRIRAGLNSLCQKLDRIVTGDYDLNVIDNNTVPIAGTMNMGRGGKATVAFNHQAITDRLSDGTLYDRTVATLGANMHELGHLIFTPAWGNAVWRRKRRENYYKYTNSTIDKILNMLEDQRQELLLGIKYPKARDWQRIILARVIASWGLNEDALMLFHGRRHLLPRKTMLKIEAMFEKRHGAALTDWTKKAITEFQSLTTDKPSLERMWDIAVEFHNRFKHDKMPLDGSCGSQTSAGAQAGKSEQAETAQRAQDALKELDKKRAEETEKEAQEAAQSPTEDSGSDKPDKTEEAGDDEPGEETGRGTADTHPDEEDTGASPSPSGGGAAPESSSNSQESAPDSENESGDTDDSGEDSRGVDDGIGTAKGGNALADEIAKAISDQASQVMDRLGEDLEDSMRQLDDAINGAGYGGDAKTPMALNNDYKNDAIKVSKLFREITDDLRTAEHRNMKSGRLDIRRLSACLAGNSNRMFKKRQPDLTHNAAMAIAVMFDTSTSMGETGTTLATRAAFTLAKGAELANHKVLVENFSTETTLLKDWDDRIYDVGHVAVGGTYPYQGLLDKTGQFAAITAKEDISHKVLIICTDGQFFDNPAVGGTYDNSGWACGAAMRRLVKQGVQIYIIRIMDPVYWGKGGAHEKMLVNNPSYKAADFDKLYGPIVKDIQKVLNADELFGAMKNILRKLEIEITQDIKRRMM